MAEADDTSNPKFLRPEQVPDCAARLEALYQLAEEVDDPEAPDTLVDAWYDAEGSAIAALATAFSRTPGEMAVKVEWMALLVDRYGGSAIDDGVLHELVASVVRDAHALAVVVS